MHEINPETVVDHLRRLGRIPRRVGRSRAGALGWGVSNVVVRVEVEGEAAVRAEAVARAVADEGATGSAGSTGSGPSGRALELLGTGPGRGGRPARPLQPSRDNYLFAMTAAPPDDSVVWKEQLLEGAAEPDVAAPGRGDPRARCTPRARDHPGLSAAGSRIRPSSTSCGSTRSTGRSPGPIPT